MTRARKAKDAKLQAQDYGIRAQYDVGGNGRRMRGWNPPHSGPNRALQGLPKIRDRSRDATRNDGAAAAGVSHWTTNLIGTGIVPRAKRITDKAKKSASIDRWNEWVRVSDADGVLNFYGQQTLVTRAWFESGECFVRLRYRRPTFGMAVPLQVQLIESDYVPMLDTDYWPGMMTGNRIRSGIELNNMSQRVAYWIFRAHPVDFFSVQVDMTMLVRVPADEILHVFEPKRPGQLRGVPDFSPVLARLRNIADFDDAVLERQKLANLFAAFLKKPAPDADGLDAMSGKPIEYGDDGSPMAQLAPGIFQELLPGEEVQFSTPPDGGANYAEYMRTQFLGASAGQGLPYELVTGDIRQVSDRTLRVIINEFRRFAEQRQWQIIIPQFCQPVRDAYVDQAVLAGEVSASDADDEKRVEWSPHGWEYLHPVQDVQAKQAEVQAGFRSRDSVIAEQGDDPEIVDEEREIAQKRAADLGLPDTTAPTPAAPAATPGEKPAAPSTDPTPAAPKEPAPAEPTQNAMFEVFARAIEQQNSKIDMLMSALAGARDVAPPAINVTMNLPSGSKTVRRNTDGTMTVTEVPDA